MVADVVDLRAVVPVHGALFGDFFSLVTSCTHILSFGRALQGFGLAKLSAFASGALCGTQCAFVLSWIPLMFGGETSGVPLPWGPL